MRKIKYLLAFTLVFALCLAALGAYSFKANLQAEQSLPNILLIISDDQRVDQNKYMPRVMKYIAEQGISYNKAYVSTPLCCPSRAALFTGQYNSRNLVLGNNFPLKGQTIFKDLSDKYYLGIVGKYLNSHDGRPLKEFDYWAVHPYGSVGYERQRFNVNGNWRNYVGPILPRMQLFARNFLKSSKKQKKPWFLTYALFHPHSPAIPDKRDRGRYAGQPLTQRPNYRVTSIDKPGYIRNSKINSERVRDFQSRQRETIFSMDRDIGHLLNHIEKTNQLKNTLVIFLADNGIFHGEHNLTSKVAPYEEATKVPVFMRYDGVIPKGRNYDQLTGLIDITATIYDLTGVTPQRNLDGVSLVPTFDNDAPVRDRLLLEAWKNGWKFRESFYAIHTGEKVLVNNHKDVREFYDLTLDPYQLLNIYDKEENSAEVVTLQAELEELVIDTRGGLGFDLPVAEKVKPNRPAKR